MRYQTRVVAAEPRGKGRVLLRQEATLEVEGQEKPALVAELLALYVARGALRPRAAGYRLRSPD